MFSDKIILLTGGTGSFGTAVLKRLLQTDIKEIRIFSRDEKKQHDMRFDFADSRIRYFIGDVRDKDSLDYAIQGCNYIFHAAALKQIPSNEFFPMEAVKTNILGTDHVLEKAIFYSVEKVVCLSTDKSVYPISAMGISKAMMEKIIIARSRMSTNTIITCARYGNVLASRGSVIPLFVSQIKQGREITVTDPEMTRFMMSIDEAVELVLFSFEHGRSGDIFVQKAPSATIGQLASILLDIYKGQSNIQITGTRNGDKTHETLVTKEESANAEDMGNFIRVVPSHNDLSYTINGVKKNPLDSYPDGYHSHNTKKLSSPELKELLLQLDFIKNNIEVK